MTEIPGNSSWFTRGSGNVVLTLHLQPGAKKNEFCGVHGNALKIRIQAPPVDGKANQALLKFLATSFAVPLRQVSLLQGETSRRKIVQITNVNQLPEILKSYIP